jgi:ankyrin repeat protein
MTSSLLPQVFPKGVRQALRTRCAALICAIALFGTLSCASHSRPSLQECIGQDDRAGVLAAIDSGEDVNTEDILLGWTPLSYAVYRRDVDLCRLLLEHGADARMASAHSGRTPLHGAALSGSVTVGELLVEAGAQIDAVDSRGRMPLHEAVENGRTDFASWLITSGADVDAQDMGGSSPLHLAVRSSVYVGKWPVYVRSPAAVNLTGAGDARERETRARDLVDGLLRAGAEVGPVDAGGEMPLSLAVRTQQSLVVERLLEAGADPDGRVVPRTWSMVHIAAYTDDVRTMNALVAHGAMVDAADADGNTPLHIAAQRGHESLVRCLLRAGADPDPSNAYESTPADCARYEDHRSIVRILLEAAHSARNL